MPTRKLERSEWQPYFDRVSRTLEATKVEVRVEGPDIGSQVELRDTTLQGLSYDPRSDLFEVSTDSTRHLIDHPRDIYVRESEGGLTSLEVVDADERKQVVVLDPVLALPSK